MATKMTVNGATYEARAICKLSQQVATVQARLAGPGGEWVDVTLPYVDADVRDAAVAACGRDVAYYRMRAELAARHLEDPMTIDVQNYSWGRLVVLRRGIDFSVVLHPEHQAELAALVAGETRVLRVEDGSSWTARVAEDGGLCLRSRGRRVHLDPDQAATVTGGSW